MKYYLIAGEASGDLHGSNLVKALKSEDAHAHFRAWGGDLMSQAGAQVVKHYKDLAFMGFIEVIKHLNIILNNIKQCKKDITDFQPDVLILIDYPGFNLRIAKWAHSQGIKVFYYISPQLWAWHSSRVHQIKKHVSRMFVILPFEADFYKRYDYEVDFVGHPLLDVVTNRPANDRFIADAGLSSLPIIALLPGSRRQEIQRMLQTMLQVVENFPGYQFVIAGAPAMPLQFYRQLIETARLGDEARSRLHIIENRTYDLLQHASAALVTSGTATLETALFNVPEVVCYSGNTLSYWIARQVINVKYISLVNLIVDKPLVKELIQHDFTPAKLTIELNAILDIQKSEILKTAYQELRQKLGQAGASQRAAKRMFELLN